MRSRSGEDAILVWPWLVIAMGFGLAAILPILDRVWPRIAIWVPAVGLAAAFVAFLRGLVMDAGAGARLVTLPWATGLGWSATIRLDGLSLLFALLVTGIGSLVFVYTAAYIPHGEGRRRLVGMLAAFSSSMLGLVLADDLVLMFVFWELTGLTSFFLIGGPGTPEARAAANQALVITVAGGLALFVAVLLIHTETGITSWTGLLAAPGSIHGGAMGTALVLLVAGGAFTKSAQVPLHFWLPGAMVAPTPVSAYLHSATMVKAGVFVLLRFLPSLGDAFAWTPLLVAFGGATMLLGAWIALRERDMKRLLAFSTISALGTMVMLIGIGSPAAVVACLTLIVAHAAYKAGLFMVAGSLVHAAGTRDLARLGGLGRDMRWTAAAGALCAAGLAGMAPLLGFVGKEAVFDAILGWMPFGPWLALARALTTTAFVALALVIGVRPFYGPRPVGLQRLDDVPRAMWLPPLALGALGLLLGLGAGPTGRRLVGPAFGAVLPGAPVPTLALWHGLTPALGLSMASLAAGLFLFRAWPRVQYAFGAARSRGPRMYSALYQALQQTAGLFVRRVQIGQLTVYLLFTVLAAILAGGLPLVLHGSLSWPQRILNVTFHEWAVFLVLLLGGGFVVRAREPLSAVIALGTTGYAVALVFVFFGAPDLAMAQFMFETLAALLFLLVVPRFGGRLPGRARTRSAPWRLLVPIGFGALMGAITLVALQVPVDTIVSDHFVENADPLGRGRNVVNVILVDFRALDTLGEVTVLAVAGLGIAALLAPRPPVTPVVPRRPAPASLHRPVVLQTLTTFLIALLMVYSFFVLLRGHNAPGGGFVGGLVAGAAVGLHALAHDAAASQRLLRFEFEGFVIGGFGMILVSGALGWLVGGSFLTSVWAPGSLPVLGGFKIGTPLLFDLGVYAIVFGVTAMTLVRLQEDV